MCVLVCLLACFPVLRACLCVCPSAYHYVCLLVSLYVCTFVSFSVSLSPELACLPLCLLCLSAGLFLCFLGVSPLAFFHYDLFTRRTIFVGDGYASMLPLTSPGLVYARLCYHNALLKKERPRRLAL